MTIPGANNTIRAELEGKLEKFGRAYGQGQNSRPMAALAAVEAAQNNAIGPDDAAELWSRFQAGNAKAKGVEYREEGSVKVQTSKFRQFIVMGSTPGLDAMDVMNRTVDVIKELAAGEDKLGGSAYDKLVAVVRAQIKNEAVPLTDDEIRSVVMPEAKEKTEEQVLESIKSSMNKAYFGNKDGTAPTYPSKELEKAIEQIESRLAEITGVRTQKAEDTQLAALLAKRGMTLADVQAEALPPTAE
jgi:hypothetical protein